MVASAVAVWNWPRVSENSFDDVSVAHDLQSSLNTEDFFISVGSRYTNSGRFRNGIGADGEVLVSDGIAYIRVTTNGAPIVQVGRSGSCRPAAAW